MIAAAAKDDYDCKNYNPGAVIVKDVAKAVVHYVPPKMLFSAFFRRTLTFYEKHKIALHYALTFPIGVGGNAHHRGGFYSKENTALPSFTTSLPEKALPFLEINPPSFSVFPSASRRLTDETGISLLHILMPTLNSQPSA